MACRPCKKQLLFDSDTLGIIALNAAVSQQRKPIATSWSVVIVPIGEDIANGVQNSVCCGSVCVPMDHDLNLVIIKNLIHCTLIDIHNHRGLLCLVLLTLYSHIRNDVFAFVQRQRQEFGLPVGLTHHGAELLIRDIIGAELIAVR